jgi:hypothetical protein
VLFDRIWDSGKEEVEKLGNNDFNYCLAFIAGKKKPTWLLLLPEAVPPVQGVDMAMGTQVGYFGRTNKKNAVRGIWSNFLSTEKIVRPAFEPKKKPKKKRTSSRQETVSNETKVEAENETSQCSESGGPSDACRKLIPKMKFV